MKKINYALAVICFIVSSHICASDSAWNAENTTQYIEGCISGVAEPAKVDYYKRAKEVGNANPKPFPEELVRSSIKPMCVCFANQLKAKGIPPYVTSQDIIGSVVDSGECKMGGIFSSMYPQKNSEN